MVGADPAPGGISASSLTPTATPFISPTTGRARSPSSTSRAPRYRRADPRRGETFDLPRRPALLRDLRAGQDFHARVHAGQPVIPIWAGDNLSAARRLRGGQRPPHRGLQRLSRRCAAVNGAVRPGTLWTSGPPASHVQVGSLRLDTAARTATVAGASVKLSRTEFDLLTSSPATRRSAPSSRRPS